MTKTDKNAKIVSVLSKTCEMISKFYVEAALFSFNI
jgi:hypothetical protein